MWKIIKKNALFSILAFSMSCGNSDDYSYQEPYDPDPETEDPLTDTQLMDTIQWTTFKYFWDFAESNSGAARERYHPNDPSNSQNVVTTGGSGFGLMAILVGMDRGYVSRNEGVSRLSQILHFFENANRFHGAWPHWIDGGSGNVIPFSNLDNGGDIVETAFFCQGLICVKEYLKNGNTQEQELSNLADTLWKGVEWNWYTQGQNELYWHWSPNHGFAINLALKGYNETLIAFIMAAASPDYSISPTVYSEGWASNGTIASPETQYGIPLIFDHVGAGSGPLFWAHYSYLGLDPRNLSDSYGNFWQANVNHTKINRQYCIENPHDYADYGQKCWGLTASYTRNSDGSLGYSAHSPSNDSGVISPTAATSSIVYTPEESLQAMHFFYEHDLLGPAGFYDAYSPSHNWIAKAYLAIDQGPQIVMIENHRTQLLWNLFMQNTDIQNGLNSLNFNF